jgi:hypothetical protein
MLTAMLLMATMATTTGMEKETDNGVPSMFAEETPDVFLAKSTLQQYLSRVVRKDWDGARRLTHPKTLAAIAQIKKRTGSETHDLAPWANKETQLKTFRFVESRQIAPGVVSLQVGEDNLRSGQMTKDEPAVYILFKSRGGFLIGDKKSGTEIAEVTAESARTAYNGFVDVQVQAQARRDSGLHEGHHR